MNFIQKVIRKFSSKRTNNGEQSVWISLTGCSLLQYMTGRPSSSPETSQEKNLSTIEKLLLPLRQKQKPSGNVLSFHPLIMGYGTGDSSTYTGTGSPLKSARWIYPPPSGNSMFFYKALCKCGHEHMCPMASTSQEVSIRLSSL